MRILVIGAGPGGYETALAAVKNGFEVTLTEAGQVGGTCLNAGCIPTKAYCRSAEIMDEIHHADMFGVHVREPFLDFKEVKSRKDAIVSSLRTNVENMLSAAGVELVRGRARFLDSRTVMAGEREYRSDYTVIATGSVPFIPQIPGIDLDGVLDSAGMLRLDIVPGRLCIIGGGVIGLEFASVFSTFGARVTVVESCREVLPRYDSDIAKRLRQNLARSVPSAGSMIRRLGMTALKSRGYAKVPESRAWRTRCSWLSVADLNCGDWMSGRRGFLPTMGSSAWMTGCGHPSLISLQSEM